MEELLKLLSEIIAQPDSSARQEQLERLVKRYKPKFVWTQELFDEFTTLCVRHGVTPEYKDLKNIFLESKFHSWTMKDGLTVEKIFDARVENPGDLTPAQLLTGNYMVIDKSKLQ